MVSNGKKFENKIRNWHKDLDCLTFKFPDYASSGNMQKALCDRVTITPKDTFWFECKHTNSKTSFALSLIKPHQMKSMLRIEELTNTAYFLIEDGHHNVYKIPPKFIKNYTKRKSIKFQELARFLTKKETLLNDENMKYMKRAKM